MENESLICDLQKLMREQIISIKQNYMALWWRISHMLWHRPHEHKLAHLHVVQAWCKRDLVLYDYILAPIHDGHWWQNKLYIWQGSTIFLLGLPMRLCDEGWLCAPVQIMLWLTVFFSPQNAHRSNIMKLDHLHVAVRLEAKGNFSNFSYMYATVYTSEPSCKLQAAVPSLCGGECKQWGLESLWPKVL